MKYFEVTIELDLHLKCVKVFRVRGSLAASPGEPHTTTASPSFCFKKVLLQASVVVDK